MTLICHETHENLDNPFYIANIWLNDRKNGMVAMYALDIALSRDFVGRIPLKEFPKSLDEIAKPLVYTIQEAIGRENQFGYVQICWGWEKTGTLRHLTEKQAQRYIPRVTKEILERSYWMEKEGDKWKKSGWAHSFYEGLKSNKRRGREL